MIITKGKCILPLQQKHEHEVQVVAVLCNAAGCWRIESPCDHMRKFGAPQPPPRCFVVALHCKICKLTSFKECACALSAKQADAFETWRAKISHTTTVKMEMKMKSYPFLMRLYHQQSPSLRDDALQMTVRFQMTVCFWLLGSCGVLL